MSGIAVIYNLDGRPADPALLERMLAVIPYRGPDGTGRWLDGPIAIGHAMLHTTPESLHENQPMSEEGLCLSFDGRIDNREELRAALESAGAILRSETDAEMVLRAYQVWGLDSPKKLLGDFAYALWDGREHRLLCTRDPLGMKPLYYYAGGRLFICASDLCQILEHPEVPRKPNEAMVGEYLCGAASSREETTFDRILKIEPGSSLIIRRGGVNRQRWFDPVPKKQIRYRSDDEYAEHLRGLVEEAVRCRMRSATGVAAELSGGVDSSSVVGVAQQLMRDGRVAKVPFETFSMWFSHPDSDESRYINEAVAMWQLVSNRVEPTISGIASYAEQVHLFKDLPTYPSFEMILSLKALVREKGFRVCLTGIGGDEWQAGSLLYYADLLRRLRLLKLIGRLREDADLAKLDKYRPFRPFTLIRTYALWPLIPEPVRRLVRLSFRRSPLPQWLEPEFARRTGLAERARSRPQPARGMGKAQADYYQLLLKASSSQTHELMERWGSRFSFETRHPLHDLRIVEFTLATPEEQRRRGVLDKFVFRRAMRGMAPEAILKRADKADFTHVFISSFEKLGGERLFDSLDIARLGWVNAERVREAYRTMISLYRDGDASYARYTWTLFTVFAAELWFNSVFLGKEADSATYDERLKLRA